MFFFKKPGWIRIRIRVVVPEPSGSVYGHVWQTYLSEDGMAGSTSWGLSSWVGNL